MEFLCADFIEPLVGLKDESFDLIICKGSFDAVLCGSGSVANIQKVVRQSHRLLARGHGIFFVVTYGNADNRIVFLEHKNTLDYYWQGVSVQTIPRRLVAGKKATSNQAK